MEYFPFVIQAVPGENRSVYAYFSDGSVRLYDVADKIIPGTVFEALQDEQFFREQLTVMDGAVAWDVSGNRDAASCIDIDPISMYGTAQIVRDPLADSRTNVNRSHMRCSDT